MRTWGGSKLRPAASGSLPLTEIHYTPPRRSPGQFQEAHMSPFLFNLGQSLKISASGESGIVTGRCEFLSGQPQYLLRYKAADGRAVESFWGQDALGAA